jgi:galactose mutarotase-like enzyme
VTTELEHIVTLANDELQVTISPGRGARITSLLSRIDGREWLAQPRQSTLAERPLPGATFTETDHFGIDEMFPTVDPCTYPLKPYAGAAVPDHGELWTTSWDTVSSSPSSVTHRMRSDLFNYFFERTLTLEGATLRANYTLEVHGPPASLLWAWHPQFAMREGSRVLVAEPRTSVLDTSLPLAPRDVVWLGDLVVERDVPVGEDRMFYLHPDDKVSSAQIIDASNASLSLRWENAFALYLGIWVDHGRHTSGRVVAIEPTNGFYDDLARCCASGNVTEFQTHDPISWWVELRVATGGQS